MSNKKIVTISGGSRQLSVDNFINRYSPNHIRKLTSNEKKSICSLKNEESYFLPVDSYLCKITRVR